MLIKQPNRTHWMAINPKMTPTTQSKAVILIPTSRNMPTTIANMTAMQLSRLLTIILIKFFVTLWMLTFPISPLPYVVAEYRVCPCSFYSCCFSEVHLAPLSDYRTLAVIFELKPCSHPLT